MTHTISKNIFRTVDWITVGFYLLFVVWGWTSVFSATYDAEDPNVFGLDGNSGKQLLWIGISAFLAVVLLLIEKRVYEMYAIFIYFAFVGLLIITLIIAPETKGSRSWIPIGFMKLQPAEFAKFGVALMLGHMIDKLGFSLFFNFFYI